MTKINERHVIALVSAVQFINVLDFVMVMPLGPEFAEALNIPASEVGIVGGSYTAAAAISGIICSFFLDRFDRKKAVVFVLSGLALGTFSASFAVNFPTLIMARVVAGIFGGPVSSLSLAIVADIIPPERRGKAMGIVMGTFSIASVLGIPAGLELAHLGNWTTPFFALGSLAFLTVLMIYKLLPPLTLHFNTEGKANKRTPISKLLARREVVLTYVLALSLMTAAFLIIPNIAAYVQLNLGFPRASMGFLYMIGGLISFIAMRFAGPLVDRKGALFVSCIGTVSLILVFYFGFYNHHLAYSPMWIFITMMLAMSFRNVSYQTFASKVPRPEERAGFLSIQSTVQHFGCSLGAFMSAHFLYELPNKNLGGMPQLALASMILASLMPFLIKLATPKTVN